MRLDRLESPFLRYLIDHQVAPGKRLPALSEIGQDMGISVGKLREQVEVARSLGLVSARPRLGVLRRPFDFARMTLDSVLFGLASGEAQFEQYSRLRQVVEAGFWDEAVVLLTAQDRQKLHDLVDSAWKKLRGEPIHVPNGEHRDFHLLIFSRLDNPFVQGILRTYWDAYEASEFTRFMRYAYWIEVWTYHERIAAAICENELALGRRLLVEHFSLLGSLPATAAELPGAGTQLVSESKGEM